MDFKKLFVFISLFMFVSSSVNAEPQKLFYHVISFEKGMNTHISPWILQDNQSSVSQNIRYNKIYGGFSKRSKGLTYGSDSNPVTGLHRYYNSSDVKRLIRADSTKLYVGNDDTGAWTQIGQGFTDGKWWNFVNYKDIAIGMNGSDNAIKYDGCILATANTDGHRTAKDLFAELGAPFAELNTGTDLDASKWYQYKVAFYDGTSYYYSTAKSNPILTGAAVYNISLTDIPIGNTDITHRYIYRTLGAASRADCVADTTYYLVGTLADNSTTTLSDTVTDDTADDDAAPKWSTAVAGTNVTPPACKYPLIHVERLFLAGDTDNPSDLNWSDEYNPDFFLPTDYERIREDDGDSITFIREQNGVLTVAKENTIQLYFTDASSSSSWYTSTPKSFVGCPAPYSVANTPKGLFYLGRGGIYRFDGRMSHLASDAVTPEIADILETALDDVSGFFWKNEYHMAYTSSSSGATANDRVLVYDLVRDAYTLDHKSVNRWIAFNAGTDYGILYSGGSDSSGTVYALEGSAKLFDKRYKSEFDAGTYDDVRSYGTQNSPILELGWDCTINGWLTELKTKDSDIDTIDEIVTYLADAIIDRPDTDGTWVSPAYQINAEQFDKIYWNENLGSFGDITVQFRVASTSAGLASATYGTAYTDPSGSDISSVTANSFIQFRFNLSTSNIDYTPTMFVSDGYLFKMDYSKRGTTYEGNFASNRTGGWTDFKIPAYNKDIRRIKIFYTGSAGALTVNFKNDTGDFDTDFDIDLSISPQYTEPDTDNTYSGTEDHKIYTYYTCDNSEGDAPTGQFWQFSFSDESTNEWTVERMEIVYTRSLMD